MYLFELRYYVTELTKKIFEYLQNAVIFYSWWCVACILNIDHLLIFIVKANVDNNRSNITVYSSSDSGQNFQVLSLVYNGILNLTIFLFKKCYTFVLSRSLYRVFHNNVYH